MPNLLLRALFPHFCVACRREGVLLCATCVPPVAPLLRAEDADVPPGLDGMWSVADYKGSPLAALLRAWKYERVTEAGRAVTRLFARALADDAEPLAGAVLVPVPMHWFRESYRGFNQADALAAAAANALQLPVRSRLLRRRFRKSRQAELDGRAARLRNARGSIAVTGRVEYGSRYALIDDVATTGATLSACAAALRRAGAGEVLAVTLLRD